MVFRIAAGNNVRAWGALVCGLVFGLGVRGHAEEPISFNRDIRPILSDNCFPCHGPDAGERKADLRLDLRSSAVGEGAITPGAPERSELLRRVAAKDPDDRMPPPEMGKVLTGAQRKLLSRWIAEGAPYESHWAFIPPERPRVPEGRATHPIDRFIQRRLNSAGLTRNPPVSRERLLRRLSFDLIGLPPDRAELDSFLADRRADAVERAVDRLLGSDRYGEHMAVAWLDAARYADTNGYNNDTPRANWRWRDWVVSAFNRNLPFDQFVVEQLAGDLLPGATRDQRVATGFNRNHSVTSEGGIIDEEYRLEYVADRVHTTSLVFMALSLQCARCHDHKFDPISQREYYQFFAYFNQVPETGYHHEHVGNPKPVLRFPTSEQSRKEAAFREELTRVSARVKGGEDLSASDREALLAREKTLKRGLADLDQAIGSAMVMREQQPMRETFLLARGAYDQPGERVGPAVPSVLPAFPTDAPRNRLGLARWLTLPDHPLTARVMVNRLWFQLFGRGLVETVEDFGSQGAWPSHPELLDWLALEFVENGWDVKALLKTITTSATYQQSARWRVEEALLDPDNQWLARGPRVRLSAEMIRDSALTLGGLLQHRLGGPSVRPYQPAGLWEEVAVADASYSGGAYRQDQGADLYRRSVYTWWKRTCPPPALSTFDAPNREFCTVRRGVTNTPLQALVLLNDPTYVEAARGFAERIWDSADASDDGRIRFAFREATSRQPTASELAVVREILQGQRVELKREPERVKALLSVGDSLPDPRIPPIELAAWSGVARLLLNLDETLHR